MLLLIVRKYCYSLPLEGPARKRKKSVFIKDEASVESDDDSEDDDDDDDDDTNDSSNEIIKPAGEADSESQESNGGKYMCGIYFDGNIYVISEALRSSEEKAEDSRIPARFIRVMNNVKTAVQNLGSQEDAAPEFSTKVHLNMKGIPYRKVDYLILSNCFYSRNFPH